MSNTLTREELKKNSLLYSNLNGKDKTTQLNLLKDLEKKSGNVFEIVYGLDGVLNKDSFHVTTWNNPVYMKYDSTINFSKLLHPTGIENTSYALKLFCYIDITSDGLYIFTNNKNNVMGFDSIPLLNLFLNGYKILDNITTSNEVFLKKGTYLLYIEFGNTQNTINLTLNLKGSTTTSIDTFISSTPYKLLSNITNKRDESIVTYCNDSNIFTSGNVCDTSLKSNDLLNDKVQTTCFNRGPNKDSLFTETKDGKTLFHPNCKNIINDSTINKTISDNTKSNYNSWANKVVNDNKINDNKDRLEEYLNILKPDENTFTLHNNLINYCETNSKDSYNIPPNDTLCNSIYNRTYTSKNKTAKDNSINKIKTNYCTGNDANGKPRYENDPLCKNDYTGLLNSTIQSRCLPDGKYKGDDQWCNTLTDNNITSTQDPYKKIISGRNNLIKNQISATTTTQTTPLLDTNTYNYVIGKYNDSTSKKLPEELLNQKLYDYCETKETNYPTIDNSQCKGIYNKFSTNQEIKDSQKRMQESLCQLPTNITTSNPNDGKTNAYLCKDTIFNTTDNLAKFATTVATHCATNINSPECTNYYQNIEDKILQQYIQPNAIPLQTVSKFSNRNKDTSLHEYQNVVLEAYENGTELSETNVTTETESSTNESGVFPVESNLIILSEVDNNDTMYWILLFIFFLLIITLIYSCSCNKKKINQENIPIATPVNKNQ